MDVHRFAEALRSGLGDGPGDSWVVFEVWGSGYRLTLRGNIGRGPSRSVVQQQRYYTPAEVAAVKDVKAVVSDLRDGWREFLHEHGWKPEMDDSDGASVIKRRSATPTSRPGAQGDMHDETGLAGHRQDGGS